MCTSLDDTAVKIVTSVFPAVMEMTKGVWVTLRIPCI